MFGVNAHKKTTDAVVTHGAKWLRSKHSSWVLAVLSFAESLFAPIIIDPFLIALILAEPKKWKRFIVISIAASVVGGVCAYFVGSLFFDTFGVKIIEIYSLDSTFESFSKSLDSNGFVFVLIGAFTPIPYKIVALASGLMQINFLTFLTASVIGRILRLGLVGLSAHSVVPRALPLVRKHLFSIAAVSGVILVVYFLVQVFL